MSQGLRTASQSLREASAEPPLPLHPPTAAGGWPLPGRAEPGVLKPDTKGTPIHCAGPDTKGTPVHCARPDREGTPIYCAGRVRQKAVQRGSTNSPLRRVGSPEVHSHGPAAVRTITGTLLRSGGWPSQLEGGGRGGTGLDPGVG
ncbi:hypothetical protein EYF80_028632 [Liparis tanakae]|uniref:Uncharacterized protein n=1 Tax=Liparis tanakae TaxID=230148 RepID=A0A4Z2H8D9_9TELE|nr:hypothetical protein EYF80_028632 [Liparis tanakae]